MPQKSQQKHLIVDRNHKITKILITGATGFVGSHILETLIKIQHSDLEIVAACRDPSKLIPHYTGEVRKGDLRDTHYLDRVLVGIDIICHAAGWSSFENSGKTSTHAYLEPTLDLINHAIEWRVSRFINLSSVYVASVDKRNDANEPGHPRAYWPMINCLIAVEDYLRDYQQCHCQFINLRLGLYSGKRLNMGLLPLLLTHNKQISLPYLTGTSGYLPLVDGRDIGQAFIRAALSPIDTGYSSMNIIGSNMPTHREAMAFIKNQIQSTPLNFGLPVLLANPLFFLYGILQFNNKRLLITRAMRYMLQSSTFDNTSAIRQIGYDPEISWQASLLYVFESYKNQSLNQNITQPDPPLNL